MNNPTIRDWSEATAGLLDLTKRLNDLQLDVHQLRESWLDRFGAAPGCSRGDGVPSPPLASRAEPSPSARPDHEADARQLRAKVMELEARLQEEQRAHGKTQSHLNASRHTVSELKAFLDHESRGREEAENKARRARVSWPVHEPTMVDPFGHVWLRIDGDTLRQWGELFDAHYNVTSTCPRSAGVHALRDLRDGVLEPDDAEEAQA